MLVLQFCLFFSTIQLFSAEISVTRISNSEQVFAPGDLIFSDEFDFFNESTWHHEINMNGGGNNEFQIYDKHPENTYVRNGVLFLKPTLTADKYGSDFLTSGHLKLEGCTDDFGCDTCCERQGTPDHIIPPVISSRLRSKGSFAFKYGRVEVRARNPSGDWTWPAIWLLPEDWVYGAWPASGEIDIMESRGNRQLFNPSGQNIGSEQVGSTLHYGPFWPHNGWWAAHGNRNSEPLNGYDRDFHLYQVEWTPEFIKFSVDNQELRNIVPPQGGFFELGQFPNDIQNPWRDSEHTEEFRMAPFDKAFHLILNVASGGNFFPDDASGPYPKPWHGSSQFQMRDFWNAKNNWTPSWNEENAALQVDYIKVWAI